MAMTEPHSVLKISNTGTPYLLLSLVEANRETYQLIRNGVKVQVQNKRDGGQETKAVKVINWKDPDANDFFLGITQ